MGEAKRRAERRREARENEATAKPRFTMVEVPVPQEYIEQVRMRHAMVIEQFATLGSFLWALAHEGVDAFDKDIQAVLAHARGETKPVDPAAQEDRLVLSPDEVPQEQTRVLAKLHEANLMGGRG